MLQIGSFNIVDMDSRERSEYPAIVGSDVMMDKTTHQVLIAMNVEEWRLLQKLVGHGVNDGGQSFWYGSNHDYSRRLKELVQLDDFKKSLADAAASIARAADTVRDVKVDSE